MTLGRAAKVALDAKLLVEFIDLHTTYRTDGNPKRKRRYLNGTFVNEVDARIIRRWRNTAEGVTPAAADRLLSKANLRVTSFVMWTQAKNTRPAYLRGPN
jgi:hypothetical protein